MRAFLRKEWMELCRTGRLLILLLVFGMFGIMNPAIAKLTPWLMEAFSESMADTGIILGTITVDAMTSWIQFYKNIPIGIVVFILVASTSFAAEYQKGTLIPVVTKGLARWKILLAKALTLFLVWTVVYWLCFFITYGYNEYFWGNGAVSHPMLAGALTWFFGGWLIGVLVFFSAFLKSGTQVILGTGGVVLGVYVLSMIPKLGKVLPVRLMDGVSLLQGISAPGEYWAAATVAGGTAGFCLIPGGRLL